MPHVSGFTCNVHATDPSTVSTIFLDAEPFETKFSLSRNTVYRAGKFKQNSYAPAYSDSHYTVRNRYVFMCT
jgi:hypothetical protein